MTRFLKLAMCLGLPNQSPSLQKLPAIHIHSTEPGHSDNSGTLENLDTLRVPQTTLQIMDGSPAAVEGWADGGWIMAVITHFRPWAPRGYGEEGERRALARDDLIQDGKLWMPATDLVHTPDLV